MKLQTKAFLYTLLTSSIAVFAIAFFVVFYLQTADVIPNVIKP